MHRAFQFSTRGTYYSSRISICESGIGSLRYALYHLKKHKIAGLLERFWGSPLFEKRAMVEILEELLQH
jgi:hypothetical protein